jgi:hypothetical protein
MSIWGELRRRKVVKVAAVYAVTAWLLVQVVVTVEEPLGLPGWVDTLVIVLLATGFPVALVLSWAFDVTPEGIRQTTGSHGAPAPGGSLFGYVSQGLVLLAVAFLVVNEFVRDREPAPTGVTTAMSTLFKKPASPGLPRQARARPNSSRN